MTPGHAALLRLAGQFHDLGVHEHDGVLLPLLAVPIDVDDDQALGDAHLGGGDAATVVLVHGVDHLLGETLKRLVAGLARLADRGENGIGGNNNGKHGIPYSV